MSRVSRPHETLTAVNQTHFTEILGLVYLTRVSEYLFSPAGHTENGNTPWPPVSVQWTVDTTFIAGIGHQTHGTCEPGKPLNKYAVFIEVKKRPHKIKYFVVHSVSVTTSTVFIGIGENVCHVIIT